MSHFFRRAFLYLIPVGVALAFNAQAESKSVPMNWMMVPPAVQQTIMQNVGAGNRMDKIFHVTDEAGVVSYQAVIKKEDGSTTSLLVSHTGKLAGGAGKSGSGDNGVERVKIETPFEEGNSAYMQQDYPRALKILLPWAQDGNVAAQSILGTLYMEGKGTEQDYDEARKWLRLAAAQDNVSAQFNMGIMSYNGDGGEQNDGEAYLWFSLAAENGNKAAQRHLKMLRRKMPAEVVKEAQQKAAEWKPGVTADAAE